MTDRDIDDLLEEWHSGDDPREIHEYLGLRRSSWEAWVDDPDRFANAATIDECEGLLQARHTPGELRIDHVFAIGELADLVRERLHRSATDRVWLLINHDEDGVAASVTVECCDTICVRDQVFPLPNRNFSAVRDWLTTPVSPRDIVDAIDELVDWQMSQHGQRSGYDHNVNQATCPHAWCDADWHGLAITRRMQQMRRRGLVDPEYVYADDDSDVLCPGSEFAGEFTPPAIPTGYGDGGWIAPAFEFPRTYYGGLLRRPNLTAPWAMWQLPDDPFNPNEWLATGEPRWWRCDQVESLNGVDITWTRVPEDWGFSDWRRRLGPPRLTLRIGGELVDVRPSPEGSQYRYGIDSETGRLQWIEVHATHRPSVGEWRALDAEPERRIPLPPLVAVGAEDGWQNLGTVDATAIRFTPGDQAA
ncbi:hypothetical protein ACFWU5_16730 [Nocardia sp. NPDC058640]|uniref:hypothetical protein n=1 Tax=Nocardia sp. NPDC058640 TaxID=3346571 RepID=UPI00365B7527